MKAPYWSLAEVKKIAASQCGLYVCNQKAKKPLQQIYGQDVRRVIGKAQTAISRLTANGFSETKTYPDSRIMDVYGVRFDGHNWYLKLYIADDPDGPGGRQVFLSSLHPLERDLATNGGLLKK